MSRCNDPVWWQPCRGMADRCKTKVYSMNAAMRWVWVVSYIHIAAFARKSLLVEKQTGFYTRLGLLAGFRFRLEM